ncbi:MAG TPA: LrgB family protein [Firmicutes bacterium]|nr:LrgB family protein [Bacillota bacterium]
MNELLRNSEFIGAALTILSFEAASLIRRRFNNPLLNPFLISVIIIIAALKLMGLDYDSYYASARHISFLVTPATVCLAIPLYRQLAVLKSNLPAVLAGIGVGVLINAAAIVVFAKVFSLGHSEFVSLLPKSITTPIGMALSGEYGGTQSMTVVAILVTGITGNVAGEQLLKLVRVRRAVSRGLAMGASSHAIGTAKAVEMGDTEGAMSGLAIAVTGVLTVAVMPLAAQLA